MAQLIDKDALVAEIEELGNTLCERPTIENEVLKARIKGNLQAYNNVISLINTLKMKEVDLNKEIDLVEDKYYGFESLSRADVIEIIKYFFELGLKIQKGE